MEGSFHFIEVGLFEIITAHQLATILVMHMTAFPTGAFNSSIAVEIGQLEISFSTHQKSSARGMRV